MRALPYCNVRQFAGLFLGCAMYLAIYLTCLPSDKADLTASVHFYITSCRADDWSYYARGVLSSFMTY